MRSIFSVVMRTTTTRYFLISFYLSRSLRVTCIILRFFLMVLSVVCTIPIFFFFFFLLSFSYFLFLPFFLSICLSHNSLLYTRHYITALTFVTSIYGQSLMYIYIHICVCLLEDCFFPKLHVYMCKPYVLWNKMTNIRVDQHFFDRPTSVLPVRYYGEKKEEEAAFVENGENGFSFFSAVAITKKKMMMMMMMMMMTGTTKITVRSYHYKQEPTTNAAYIIYNGVMSDSQIIEQNSFLSPNKMDGWSDRWMSGLVWKKLHDSIYFIDVSNCNRQLKIKTTEKNYEYTYGHIIMTI